MSSGHDQAVLDAIFNPYQPLGEGISLQKDEQETEAEVGGDLAATALEVEAVRKAEVGMLREAVEMFGEAMKLSPSNASILNNRAQTYRLLGDDDAALVDLNRALELVGYKGKVAMQALCQRALIHRRRHNDCMARADLEAAASLGSDFAKQQLVQLNPYAAMCNQMLRQMFTKLHQPA